MCWLIAADNHRLSVFDAGDLSNGHHRTLDDKKFQWLQSKLLTGIVDVSLWLRIFLFKADITHVQSIKTDMIGHEMCRMSYQGRRST